MKLLDNNQYIPLLYWTSKQHKFPYKFLFIAGASKCYNKQLAIELSLALKCIQRQFKNYCKVIEKRAGICYYWSVDNPYELIHSISDIKTARSIKTFDFSTLYTNLPLDVIYDSVSLLLQKCLQIVKPFPLWLIQIEKTTTTRTPAFWGYPPPPHDYPHFESCWIPSENRSNDLDDIGQGQRSSHATHLLMLVIICAKYGKNPSKTVDFFLKVKAQKFAKNSNFQILKKTYNATHPLMIVIICAKYKKESIQNCRHYRADMIF